MENIIIISIIVNGIISQVIASSVKNRQISSSKVFWLSFLLTPLVGMFAAVMSPEIKENEVQEEIVQETYEDSFIPFVERNISYVVQGIIVLTVLVLFYNF